MQASKRRRPKRRSIFSMRSQISPTAYLCISTAAFVIFVLAWALASFSGLVRPIFLPSPGAVVARLFSLAADGTLFSDILASSYRIGIGFLIASGMSLMVGILMGSYRFWDAAIEPFIDFIRYMPVVAFVPLSILWTGTTDTQKFLIIWIGTFFQQALMFMDNIKRVPPDYVALGRTLSMSDFRILRGIVLPSAMPQIWDTLRVSLGWAWTWVVLAELVAADSGLGYRITVAQRYFQTDTAIAYILVLGILGLITDQAMKFAGKRLFAYGGQK